jgi:hypothetical protein
MIGVKGIRKVILKLNPFRVLKNGSNRSIIFNPFRVSQCFNQIRNPEGAEDAFLTFYIFYS